MCWAELFLKLALYKCARLVTRAKESELNVHPEIPANLWKSPVIPCREWCWRNLDAVFFPKTSIQKRPTKISLLPGVFPTYPDFCFLLCWWDCQAHRILNNIFKVHVKWSDSDERRRRRRGWRRRWGQYNSHSARNAQIFDNPKFDLFKSFAFLDSRSFIPFCMFVCGSEYAIASSFLELNFRNQHSLERTFLWYQIAKSDFFHTLNLNVNEEKKTSSDRHGEEDMVHETHFECSVNFIKATAFSVFAQFFVAHLRMFMCSVFSS